VHGPLAGVAGIPQCPIGTVLCDIVDTIAGSLAETGLIEALLAPADY
jgi:hypothetical protein